MYRARRTRIAAQVALATALFCNSLTAYSAFAAPTLPPRTDAPPNAAIITGALGTDGVSLTTARSSIAADAGFAYTARVQLRDPADNVRMRFRISHPSGRLIFQRTKTFRATDTGAVVATFERETADLGLRPGVFPVTLETGVSRKGNTESLVLEGHLLVYAPGTRRTRLAVVFQVSGQPLSDPNGRFVADPGRYVQPRDDVREVAAWVLSEEANRATLAVSPLLLEEWSRIAGGYELVGPEGTEQVPASAEVPQAYAGTLRMLANAVRSGRLELTSQGFSDPDLADLALAGLLDDVTVQYERGLSTAFASIEMSTSAGTVPSGGSIPPAAVRQLTGQGIQYAVVRAASTRSGESTAQPSSYTAPGGLIILVPHQPISDAVMSGDTSACVLTAFRRHIDDTAGGPLVVTVPLGAGGAAASIARATLDPLFGQPWVRPSTAGEVAVKTSRRIKLSYRRDPGGSPSGYWDQVRSARRWAQAFFAAEGESSAEAARAVRDSLVAECSAWAGPDDQWALADRGRSFADAARRMSAATLKKVSLRVEPVTLAGAGGDVPVVVVNDSERPLAVRLKLRAGRGVELSGPRTRAITLEPGETFVEVPVELRNALAGTLRVSVSAGDVEIDESAVPLRGSYVDRIVTIVAVLLLLGGLLIVIIRRVKSAERTLDAERSTEAYTDGAGTRRSGG